MRDSTPVYDSVYEGGEEVLTSTEIMHIFYRLTEIMGNFLAVNKNLGDF